MAGRPGARGRAVLVVSATLWLWSWTTILLEITRWHHMSWRLRFTPPPTPPGAPPAHAGLPVITVCACACAAPLVFLAAVWKTHRRGNGR